MKRFILFSILVLLPFIAFAKEDQDEESFTLFGDRFHAGMSVSIDDNVDHDVFAAGQSVSIDGDVEGDEFLAGQNVDVEKNIQGSVHAAGQTVEFSGTTARNLYAAGASVKIDKNATVERNAYLAGGFIYIDGEVGKNAYIAGGIIEIRGKIGGNVSIHGSEVKIMDGAEISENALIRYEDKFSIADGAKIGGKIDEKKIEAKSKIAPFSGKVHWGSMIGLAIIGLVQTYFAAFLFAKYLPEFVKKVDTKIRQNMASSLGWGFVFLILTPIAGVLLFITILFSKIAGVVFSLYGLAIILAKCVTALVVGNYLFDNIFKSAEKKTAFLVSLVGSLAVGFLAIIPVVGWIILFALFIIVFGGVMNVMREKIKECRNVKQG